MGGFLLHHLEGSYTPSVDTISIKRYQRHHRLLQMQFCVSTSHCSDLCYIYSQIMKLSISHVPCAFLDPIFSHLLVSYIASTMQEKLNTLLLLLADVPQWLISCGRRKQQHLRGQWLPVGLGLSLLAHGILFEGKRRKSTVKLPSTMPLPPTNNVNIRAIISFRPSKYKVHSALCSMLDLVETQTLSRRNQHSPELSVKLSHRTTTSDSLQQFISMLGTNCQISALHQ